jgi:hypothetical protein
MAPITTHLVIGERVYPKFVETFGPLDYGSFLLGNVLVDVHGFSNINRRTTHFADRQNKGSSLAFDRSCQNFIAQLDRILLTPWCEPSNTEQSFVIGYFCHLAADENWKQFDWDVLTSQGVFLWTDLKVSGDILLTVFDVLSNKFYIDHPSVSQALRNTAVPKVFSHVSHHTFENIWNIIRIHVETNSTLESFLEIQRRLGKDRDEIEEMREAYEADWQPAENIIEQYFGGIPFRVESMIRQSLETVTHTYANEFICEAQG